MATHLALFVLLTIGIVSTHRTNNNKLTFDPEGLQQIEVLLNWNGDKVNCTKNCVNNYISYNSTYTCTDQEQWNKGFRNFSDPLPPLPPSTSYLILSASLQLRGVFNCDNDINGTEITVFLNHQQIDHAFGPSEPSDCDCLACLTQMNFTSNYYSNGLPYYNYQGHGTGINTLHIQIDGNNVACIAEATLTLYFVIVQIPSVIALVPYSGPTTGNTSVTVFAGKPGYSPFISYCCTFEVGGPCQPATYIDKARIVCNSSQSYNTGITPLFITLLFNNQSFDTLSVFEYYDPPTLFDVVPSSGLPGQTIALIGTNFMESDDMRIMWGDKMVEGITFYDSSNIMFVTPQGDGTVSISLSMNGQQFSNSLIYNYLTDPDEKSLVHESSNINQIWKSVAIIALCVLGVMICIIVLVLASKRGKPERSYGYVKLPTAIEPEPVLVTSPPPQSFSIQ